jgi:hypothetical protein
MITFSMVFAETMIIGLDRLYESSVTQRTLLTSPSCRAETVSFSYRF